MAWQEGIINGFVKGGQIDDKTKAFPCLDGILKTLSRHPTRRDNELVCGTFTACFEEQLRVGRLVQSFLSSLPGIPEDANEAFRDTDALSYQRSLTINHEDMNKQQRIHMQEMEDKKIKAAAEQIGRNKTWLDVNITCVKKLNVLYILVNASGQKVPPMPDKTSKYKRRGPTTVYY